MPGVGGWVRSQTSKEKMCTKEGNILRRNPPKVRVTSGQKPNTKFIYIVLQTSVGLFQISGA